MRMNYIIHNCIVFIIINYIMNDASYTLDYTHDQDYIFPYIKLIYYF